LGGEAQSRRDLEASTGLDAKRKDLQDVINQLTSLSREKQAIPLKVQEEFAGRGATKGGVAPIETARLRRNTIEALGLSAIGATLQGNIALAEKGIQDALDAEFEPERLKLEQLQQLYAFNKDTLEREDKKRADNLQMVLSERARLLSIQEADKDAIYNLALTAQQAGVDRMLD